MINIDKAAFLSLTAAVAAASCTAVKHDIVVRNEIPATDGGTPSDAAADSGASIGDAGERADATACDDSIVTATSDGGTLCPVVEGTSIGCLYSFDCAEPSDWWKPRLTRLWQACLAEKTGLDTCWGEREKCAEDTAAAACPDSTASSFCDELATACASPPSFPKTDCVFVATPLSSSGREHLKSCFVESGCTSIRTCLPN